MILVDKPFVSDFLKITIEEHNFPVVRTEMAEQFGFNHGPNMLDEEKAVQKARSSEDLSIYTTSENAIGWIAEHLSFTGLPEKIDLFKDKTKFRTLTRSMFPGFRFKEVRLGELDHLSLNDLPIPFIIKPTVGFFSMAVHKVSDAKEWESVREAIRMEISRVKDLYPAEVLNTTAFIVEECIAGEEFAIDAYYNGGGEPVILGIYRHVFSSDGDVSDRVYLTSKEVIQSHREEFFSFLVEIGRRTGVRNFPVHAEVRRDRNGSILPIEINPMRFGGWCSTPDMTHSAYGFNPYVYYFSHREPDWDEILKGKEGKLYSIVVLDNSTGVEERRIAAFDYAKLLDGFEKPLELRKIEINAATG